MVWGLARVWQTPYPCHFVRAQFLGDLTKMRALMKEAIGKDTVSCAGSIVTCVCGGGGVGEWVGLWV